MQYLEAVTRVLIGGGVGLHVHMLVFYPANSFEISFFKVDFKRN